MVTKMNNTKMMDSLAVGESAVILCSEHPSDAMSRRLRLLGFYPGARVKCVGSSPGGKMGAYQVMGAVIALRDADARYVTVEAF